MLLTALLVLMSMLPFKYSKTLSKLPARAARKKLALPSVCKIINNILLELTCKVTLPNNKTTTRTV